MQAELNARHAGGLSLPGAALHVTSGALAAEDDREAAADRLAAFSAQEVEGLVVDLDGGELVGLAVGDDVLEAGTQAVVAGLDNKSNSTGIRQNAQADVGGDDIEDLP